MLEQLLKQMKTQQIKRPRRTRQAKIALNYFVAAGVRPRMTARMGFHQS